DALKDTVERASHYGAIARDALEIFPSSPWKSALLEVVDFCVERAY
ncbi:MAG TPA: polyprenyl synthetase family protein, partial [Methylosinus sp.]